MTEPVIQHAKVTLPSTGILVYIRKVSSSQLTLATSRAVMSSDMFIAVAAQHAQEGSDELKVYKNKPTDQLRPQTDDVTKKITDNPSEMLNFVMETNRATIAASVFRPRFDELIAMYEGHRDDIDFGLGDDFDYLLNEIKVFNRPEGLKTEAEVERFPEIGGDDTPFTIQGSANPPVRPRRTK